MYLPTIIRNLILFKNIILGLKYHVIHWILQASNVPDELDNGRSYVGLSWHPGFKLGALYKVNLQ